MNTRRESELLARLAEKQDADEDRTVDAIWANQQEDGASRNRLSFDEVADIVRPRQPVNWNRLRCRAWNKRRKETK